MNKRRSSGEAKPARGFIIFNIHVLIDFRS